MNCHNCRRKFGEIREILQAGDGHWVHNSPVNYYPELCNPHEQWTAMPEEESV